MLVLSLGDCGFSRLKQESRRVRTGEEEFQSIIRRESWILSKTKTYSSTQQMSRLSRVLVFGTVSLCKALLRYGPLCDTDLPIRT